MSRRELELVSATNATRPPVNKLSLQVKKKNKETFHASQQSIVRESHTSTELFIDST